MAGAQRVRTTLYTRVQDNAFVDATIARAVLTKANQLN